METKRLPPRKLTCPRKRDHFNRKFHLPTIDFKGYVSFQWGNLAFFLSPLFTFINASTFLTGCCFFQNSPTWTHTKTKKIVHFQRKSHSKRMVPSMSFVWKSTLLAVTFIPPFSALFPSLGGLKSSCPRMEEAFTFWFGAPPKKKDRMVLLVRIPKKNAEKKKGEV